MMKITGLSHLFKWENLHNWWLTKYLFDPLYVYMKSSFPKRYKSILIVFMKMAFVYLDPYILVNIQFIMLKWSVGSV